ncbi:hypothetical protein CXF85_15180 [Colwellia sp. 75C3]|uniref:DapH/DapD/GlmU-related protein n=1 Tax=Colwellia sp. 75C3 TaxID=888425 RepID=UPI000C3327C6|nr:DapH/DapD/GlmU-related protein [Colwellia sp. 75C3]PKG82231.1 hypothetical protein CXF85_15180 [Colwellia sp. 75C3]
MKTLIFRALMKVIWIRIKILSGIYFKPTNLIGTNFLCFDCDFYSLYLAKRLSNSYICKPVTIGENIFIGANVTILKGTVIGNDCVIGAGVALSGIIAAGVIVSNKNNFTTSEIRY